MGAFVLDWGGAGGAEVDAEVVVVVVEVEEPADCWEAGVSDDFMEVTETLSFSVAFVSMGGLGTSSTCGGVISRNGNFLKLSNNWT